MQAFQYPWKTIHEEYFLLNIYDTCMLQSEIWIINHCLRPLTFSLISSVSSWHNRNRKEFGSLHKVVLVVTKRVPPTLSLTHSFLNMLPPELDEVDIIRAFVGTARQLDETVCQVRDGQQSQIVVWNLYTLYSTQAQCSTASNCCFSA